MESKYVAGGMLAVLLTAMVLGAAAGGFTAGSHFVASAGSQQKSVFLADDGGANQPGTLSVSVTWCSDWTAVYCLPIGRATVTITDPSGAIIATTLTDAHGQAILTTNVPATYKVTADISNVSAFGFMAGAEYQMMFVGAGASVDANSSTSRPRQIRPTHPPPGSPGGLNFLEPHFRADGQRIGRRKLPAGSTF